MSDRIFHRDWRIEHRGLLSDDDWSSWTYDFPEMNREMARVSLLGWSELLLDYLTVLLDPFGGKRTRWRITSRQPEEWVTDGDIEGWMMHGALRVSRRKRGKPHSPRIWAGKAVEVRIVRNCIT